MLVLSSLAYGQFQGYPNQPDPNVAPPSVPDPLNLQVGDVWDMKSHWSDADNPSGTWSYGSGAGAFFTLLNTSVADWLSGDLGIPTPQPAWAVSAGGVPGMAKSVNNNSGGLDLLVDDVMSHAQTIFRWTSPDFLQVRVTGNAWMLRDLGRNIDVWVFERGNWANNTVAERHLIGNIDFATNPRGAALEYDLTFNVEPGQTVHLFFDGGGGQPSNSDFAGGNMTLEILALNSLASYSVPPAADLNGDGWVGISDLALFGAQWMTSGGISLGGGPAVYVKVYPPGLYGSSNVWIPAGAWLDTSGSTTAGIQEALDYGRNYNYDVHIGGQRGAVYNISSTIAIPAAQNWRINSDDVILNWTGGQVATPMITIDSAFDCDYRLPLMVYPGNGDVVVVRPTNPTGGADTQIVFTDSRLFVADIGSAGALRPGRGVVFDLTSGSILWNEIFIGPMGGFATNVDTTNPAGAAVFAYNKIDIQHVHSGGRGVAVSPKSFGNVWTIFYNSDGIGTMGLDISGSNDIYYVGIENAPLGQGIVLNSQASENQFYITQLAGGITDNSFSKNNLFHYAGKIGAGALPTTAMYVGGDGVVSLKSRPSDPGGTPGVWKFYVYENGSTRELRIQGPGGTVNNVMSLTP